MSWFGYMRLMTLIHSCIVTLSPSFSLFLFGLCLVCGCVHMVWFRGFLCWDILRMEYVCKFRLYDSSSLPMKLKSQFWRHHSGDHVNIILGSPNLVTLSQLPFPQIIGFRQILGLSL